jgi:hypothetical protein
MCHGERFFRSSAMMTFVLLTTAWSASAEPIRIPLSAFSGTEQVVEFNVSGEQLLPYFEDGVTFTYTPFGFLSDAFGALNLQRPSTGGSGTLTVTFSDPVTIAGFNFSNDTGMPTMQAEVFGDLAGLESLGQLSLGTFAPQETAFIGFATRSAFTRAEISFTVPEAASWYIDDFRFDNAPPIPEPGTISLTLLGLGLLRSRIRRRTRRA